MAAQDRMYRFFDENTEHFVLSPYSPAIEIDYWQLDMHRYFDEEHGCYTLSFYPPKAREDFKQERSDLHSLTQPILDAPLMFDPTPLLPAMKSIHVPTAQLIDVTVNLHSNNMYSPSQSILDAPLMFDVTPILPAQKSYHNVPIAQLVDVAMNNHHAVMDVYTESLLDKKFAEESKLPPPAILPVRVNVSPLVSSNHAKKHTSSTMKRLWVLMFHCKITGIFIVLTYIIYSTKFVDPRAPCANYSEVLLWSLLAPDIRYALKRSVYDFLTNLAMDTSKITSDDTNHPRQRTEALRPRHTLKVRSRTLPSIATFSVDTD